MIRFEKHWLEGAPRRRDLRSLYVYLPEGKSTPFKREVDDKIGR